MRRIIVRGVGDVGSAVAHRLFVAGYAVAIHDGPYPTTSRRANALTDAIFDGRDLARVTATRVDDPHPVLSGQPQLSVTRRMYTHHMRPGHL